jgi:hypothetical protein
LDIKKEKETIISIFRILYVFRFFLLISSSFYSARQMRTDLYTWDGDRKGQTILALGIRALPNCLYPNTNLEYDEDANEEDEHVNSRLDDYVDNPGIGATTLMYAKNGGLSTVKLKAGTELFVDYGNEYFAENTAMPFRKHYKEADRLLHTLRNIVNQVERKERDPKFLNCWKDMSVHASHPIEQKCLTVLNGTTSRAILNATFSNDLYRITQSVLSVWSNRVQATMPNNINTMNYILDVLGSTSKQYASRSIRSMAYLRQYGSCMDHLYIANSTIPFAGKGAFAKVFMPEGTLVTSLPLLHSNRSAFTIVHSNVTVSNNNPIEQHLDLFINYCFGHKKSYILLCPYGIAASFVNHPGRDRQANVRLEWSKKLMKETTRLGMPLDDWLDGRQVGLIFDYVALRDIEKDEEILFDYGIGWQEAWGEHLHRFEHDEHIQFAKLNTRSPPISINGYQNDPLVHKMSTKNLQVHLWCRNEDIMYRSGYSIKSSNPDMALYQPCKILDQLLVDTMSMEYTYTAEIVERQFDAEMMSEQGVSIRFCSETNSGQIVFGLNRDAFVFGSRERHYANALLLSESWKFRHEIQIPDDIMPKIWIDA